MEKVIINLTPETVSGFVNAANDCDFDIDVANVKAERDARDAKSIMGVMTLDFDRDIVVMYEGENEKFEAVLAKLKVPEKG